VITLWCVISGDAVSTNLAVVAMSNNHSNMIGVSLRETCKHYLHVLHNTAMSRQGKAVIHMVLYTLHTDPAHHALGRTDSCTHGQLKAVRTCAAMWNHVKGSYMHSGFCCFQISFTAMKAV